MRPQIVWIAALTLLGGGTVFHTSASAEPLKAGVASVDITPPPGLRMWGYSSRKKPAQATLDPLSARALVLQGDGPPVAIITLDLGRPPEEALIERLRRQCQQACGVERLFVTASHTHQAPSLESYNGKTNTFAAALIDKLTKLVVAASRKLTPVKVGVGRTEVDYAHNRRRLLPDGRIAMQWRNAEREPTAPVDREVTIVRLDHVAGGSPVAILFHYACHPVVLGADNLKYSADYVGEARRVVERELGGSCLFLQGGAGDINPYVDKTPIDQGGVEEMRKMGRGIGRAVVAAARDISPQEEAGQTIRFLERRIPVGIRWDIHDPKVREILTRVYGDRFTHYLAEILDTPALDLSLPTLLIGDRLALVGMPGEVFVDFQLRLKRVSPVEHTLLVGYTNGYHAYFPTIRDAAAGGYGGKVATYVAVGTGERLVDEGLISIYRLLDKLHDVPRAEDFRLLEWDHLKRSP